MLEWLLRGFRLYRWAADKRAAAKTEAGEKSSGSDVVVVKPAPWQDPAGLSGIEIDVRLSRTNLGILLVDKAGNTVTVQRSLTQSDLEKIPFDADVVKFINLTLADGSVYSCIVTPPGNEIYGSMRAFWWSLAHGQVFAAILASHRIDRNHPAFESVFMNAKSMWDIAIEKEGSIERMRDLLVPLRNVHFEVISKMIENASSDAEKLGLECARAMVLATQAEDPILEGWACRELGRFIWLPGEEPAEFRSYTRQ